MNLLDHVRIASPCPMSWDEMRGNERVRFCQKCSLHVYNVAEMTRAEAEALIIEKEGRLCARLYRRADGTILTRDCPVGLRAARLRYARMMGGIAAAVAFLLSAGGVLGKRGNGSNRLREMEPFSRVYAWFNPAPPAPPKARFIRMGMIARPQLKKLLDSCSRKDGISRASPVNEPTLRDAEAADNP